MSEGNITQPENSGKPQPIVEENSAIPKKKKFSNMMWLAIGLVLLIILGASGYFLLAGKSTSQPSSETAVTTTPTVIPTTTVSLIPTPTVYNLDTSKWSTFTSKIYPAPYWDTPPASNPKIQFTIMYPVGWQSVVSSAVGNYRVLELTKGDMTLSVNGDFIPNQLCGSTTYTVIKYFQSKLGVFRRVVNGNSSEVMSGRKGYVICSSEPVYKKGTDFTTITSLGYIQYDVSASTKDSDIEEMDQIISTIQKVK